MISAFIVYIISRYLILQVAAGFGFLVLAFLYFRLTGEKSEWLAGSKDADTYLKKKGGLWPLFKWLFFPFIFIYDLTVWIVFGINVLFLYFIDILVLINNIFYFLLKILSVPVIFILQFLFHYLIKWPWWIYKLSFQSIRKSLNRNFYLLSLRAAVTGLFAFFLFTGTGILLNLSFAWLFGGIFFLLSLVWAFGEIAGIRRDSREFNSWFSVKSRFDKGFDALRAVLFYLSIFILLLMAEIFINLTIWTPDAGFSFLGMSLTLSSVISFIMLFVFVIMVFSIFMIPAHVVEIYDYQNNLQHSSLFLAVIGRKFLKFIFAHIPAIFFAIVVSVIPALIVGIAIFFSLSVKNKIIDMRISNLESEKAINNEQGEFRASVSINRLEYYKDFPENVLFDFPGIREFIQQKNELVIKREEVISNLTTQRGKFEKYSTYDDWENVQKMNVSKLDIAIHEIQNLIIQLPFVFLFVILWISFFGGLVLAVVISYFGNLYYSVYVFREDEKPPYFIKKIEDISRQDSNQPLLGFTLVGLLILVMIILGKI